MKTSNTKSSYTSELNSKGKENRALQEGCAAIKNKRACSLSADENEENWGQYEEHSMPSLYCNVFGHLNQQVCIKSS
jgi:hypothetical protein